MALRDGEHVVGDRRFRIVLVATSEMPPEDHISAAHCIAFSAAGQVLLARHVDRQWTIPGGHREAHETGVEAMHREVMEEAAAVVVDPLLVAVERIDLLEGDPDPRYPIPAFQVFFVATVAEIAALVPNAECTESRLFAIDEARRLPGWMDHNVDLFDVAVAAIAPRVDLPRGRLSRNSKGSPDRSS